MCKTEQVIKTFKIVDIYSLFSQLICSAGYLNPFGLEWAASSLTLIKSIPDSIYLVVFIMSHDTESLLLAKREPRRQTINSLAEFFPRIYFSKQAIRPNITAI